MAYQIYAGSTSQTVRFFIQDTSVTTGAGLTGLTHSTSGLTAYYSKGGTGAATQITLASQTATGVWTSGGFCAVGATGMAGLYRLDLPNVAVDTEAEVIVMLMGAANMASVAIRITCKPIASDVRQLNGSTQNADRMPISDSAQRTVKITGSNHVAADIHETQPDSIHEEAFDADAMSARVLAADAVAEIQSGLATTANQAIIIDRVSYSLTALVGACSDAGTAAETYTLSIDGSTFTVDHTGLDATGNRGAVTLSKV